MLARVKSIKKLPEATKIKNVLLCVIEHGLVVINLYEILDYLRVSPFTCYQERVPDPRRRLDKKKRVKIYGRSR